MYKIKWSNEAKLDVKNIYDFIKLKSLESAKNLVTNIRNAPKSVVFENQYSADEYATECRKIVVKNYKILYIADLHNKTINVIAVFDTRQNPEKLSNIVVKP
ncbi:MAG: type II toxin-antitoxin system RelE/ParE family toxin [Flavobacterium sp.]